MSDFSDDSDAPAEELEEEEADEEAAAARAARAGALKRRRAEAAAATPFGNTGALAAAVSALLSAPAPSGDASGGAAGGGPILARSRTAAKRVADERAERLRLKAARRHKRELKAAGHAPPAPRGSDPDADALERRLLVTATRGVVQLFNAVSKAQKAGGGGGGGEAAGGASLAARDSAAKAVPRVFLQELRKAAGVAGGAPGWDVLADDAYARGGSSARLRAWDKPGQGGGGGARVEGDGDEEEEEEDV